ncbi:hypothetical protein HDE_12516 [Halotydeus destructor]|nr:hypothetical protein HDE_12516 [Halotydeus destructor]
MKSFVALFALLALVAAVSASGRYLSGYGSAPRAYGWGAGYGRGIAYNSYGAGHGYAAAPLRAYGGSGLGYGRSHGYGRAYAAPHAWLKEKETDKSWKLNYCEEDVQLCPAMTSTDTSTYMHGALDSVLVMSNNNGVFVSSPSVSPSKSSNGPSNHNQYNRLLVNCRPPGPPPPYEAHHYTIPPSSKSSSRRSPPSYFANHDTPAPAAITKSTAMISSLPSSPAKRLTKAANNMKIQHAHNNAMGQDIMMTSPLTPNLVGSANISDAHKQQLVSPKQQQPAIN